MIFLKFCSKPTLTTSLSPQWCELTDLKRGGTFRWSGWITWYRIRVDVSVDRSDLSWAERGDWYWLNAVVPNLRSLLPLSRDAKDHTVGDFHSTEAARVGFGHVQQADSGVLNSAWVNRSTELEIIRSHNNFHCRCNRMASRFLYALIYSAPICVPIYIVYKRHSIENESRFTDADTYKGITSDGLYISSLIDVE